MTDLIHFDHDINILTATATSFPEGVLAAHQKIHALVPFSTERMFVGISYPGPTGKIIYHAGVESLSGTDAPDNDLGMYILEKGTYRCVEIADFMKDISAIGRTFGHLLTDPKLDPHGCCVEWYFNQTDVRCMVRILAEN